MQPFFGLWDWSAVPRFIGEAPCSIRRIGASGAPGTGQPHGAHPTRAQATGLGWRRSVGLTKTRLRGGLTRLRTGRRLRVEHTTLSTETPSTHRTIQEDTRQSTSRPPSFRLQCICRSWPMDTPPRIHLYGQPTHDRFQTRGREGCGHGFVGYGKLTHVSGDVARPHRQV